MKTQPAGTTKIREELYSLAEEEYRNICRRILGEDVPFMEIRQKKGMFRRLGEIFRK